MTTNDTAPDPRAIAACWSCRGSGRERAYNGHCQWIDVGKCRTCDETGSVATSTIREIVAQAEEGRSYRDIQNVEATIVAYSELTESFRNVASAAVVSSARGMRIPAFTQAWHLEGGGQAVVYVIDHRTCLVLIDRGGWVTRHTAPGLWRAALDRNVNIRVRAGKAA